MFQDDIKQALIVLKRGGVILYPTDTVWGIGCDATDHVAVERIYTIKERSETHSMLVLVDSTDMLALYVKHMPDTIPCVDGDTERPTSVVYPNAQYLATNLIADDGSIGIRIVRDPFCQQLIKAFGKPIVSTSANISGEKTPGIFDEISGEIKVAVDYVVHWRQDDRQPAKASAIIKLNPDGIFSILRK